MSPTRIGAALALLALALLTLPAGASADSSNPTWAGTWDSDFGEMTLDAGGDGRYEGSSSGTIDGTVDGRVDQGTWDQPGNPHLSGTFKFTMSGDGLSFTGVWEYDQGGCGSACGWNGTCSSGPCKENDDPPPAQLPRCGAASFLARASADCKLGSLPVGKRVAVDTPEPGKTKNISPREIPAETYDLILEILAEQEAERLIAALTAKFGAKEAKDLIGGCSVVVQGGFEEEVFDYLRTRTVISREGKAAIYNACARLLLSASPPAPRRARVAATGCRVITVPVFEKGTKVTKRRRKQARAAILEQVKPSCDDKRKGFTASLKARGRGATLNRVTGKNIGAPLARFSDTPADGRRVSVRWKAARR